MNIYNFPVMVASLLNFSLAVFVLTKNSRCIINRTFAFWNFCIGIWNIGAFLIYTTPSYQGALLFTRLFLVNGLVFIYSSFFHFVLVFIEDKSIINKRILKIGYLSSLSLLVLNNIGFPLIGKELTKYYWGYFPKASIGDIFFGIVFGFFTTYSLYLLYNAYKKSIGYRSNQIKYVFWGSLIGFTGGSTNFLPIYGICVYPIGNISNCIYSLIVAYAIIEFRLMDINIIFKKGLVYSCWLFFIGIGYLLSVFLVKEMTTIHKIGEYYTLSLFIIMLSFFCFFLIKRKLENFLDDIILKNKYDYQNVLKNFTTSLLTILELEELVPLIVTTIYKTMHLTSCSLILYDKSKNSYSFKYLQGLKGENIVESIKLTPKSRLVEHFNKNKFILLKEEIKRNILWNEQNEELKQLHKDLEWLKSDLCIPLYMNNRLIGLLNLGNKKSGDLFNEEDLKLLTTLANQSAIAISNAQSICEIKKQQEWITKNEQLAIIGQLSSEMFHELNKSLTKIEINEQLLKDALWKDKEKIKHLEVIRKQVKRAARIVEGFSIFSQKGTPDKSLTDINELIENSLDFLANQISKNKIEIITQLDSNLPKIKINPIQIEQVLVNIIENSIQSMQHQIKGKILVIKSYLPSQNLPKELSPLAITIEIIDRGRGIPKENIGKVFKPFFSTKEEQAGAGLGLSISYRIIEQHKGTIDIESKKDKGTKVTIKLPLSSDKELNVQEYKKGGNILSKFY